MSVTSEIETRSRTNVLCVPIQSVTTRLPKGTNNIAGAGSTNSAVSTNAARADRKANEPPKPIEVVFLVDGDTTRSVSVKRGISDENYTEIAEGIEEGTEIVSGGYKAISRDLEDGKKIKRGIPEKVEEKK
jgi:HlyD family secretion protein